MSEACMFCNVDERVLIHRDDDGIVILDDPVRPGHVLVGSVVHGAYLHDISEEAAAGVLRLANRAAREIVATTGAERVYVAAIGDKDRHFHVHLVPKLTDDPNLGPYVFGANGWIGFLPALPEDDPALGEVNERLRSALAG